MSSTYSLTTANIADIFADETTTRSGVVTDTYNDGTRLFTRSILPSVKHVRPGDGLQGGVAIKAVGCEIEVHPYLFRQVCRNGAIMAHALGVGQLVDIEWKAPEEADFALREAIAACCAPEVFTASVQDFRSALQAQADQTISFMSMFAGIPATIASALVAEILSRFHGGRGRSRFALANAVTSVARDTSDPDLRWRLEELGGGIAAGILPIQPVDDPGAENECPQTTAVR